MTQKCKNCFQTKPVEEFYRRRKNSEARQWWCKACHREIHASYKAKKNGKFLEEK
jgi:hypothetical protein